MHYDRGDQAADERRQPAIADALAGPCSGQIHVEIAGRAVGFVRIVAGDEPDAAVARVELALAIGSAAEPSDPCGNG